MRKTGCFGSLLRVTLAVINLLFLLIGVSLLIGTAIVKWSTLLETLLKTDNELVKSLLNISKLNDFTIGLLCIGVFIVLLSLLGFIGACCARRSLLVIYELVLIALYFTHFTVLVLSVIYSSKLENGFHYQMNGLMDVLNSPNASDSDVNLRCKALRFISGVFGCCGNENGFADFYNKTIANQCCVDTKAEGCAQRVVRTIKENVVNIFFIPNGIILAIELLIIVCVPILICRIYSKKQSSDDCDASPAAIHVMPTTLSTTTTIESKGIAQVNKK